MRWLRDFRVFLRILICAALGAMPSMAMGMDLVVKDLSAGTETSYSEAELRALNTVSLSTTTPWTEGVQDFVGTPLADIIGTERGEHQIRLTAINDYVVTIPASAVEEDYPIVAYERNSMPMSVRDKGPYWLILPFDRDESFMTESMMSRSIWQLVMIEIIR